MIRIRRWSAVHRYTFLKTFLVHHLDLASYFSLNA